jgi:uncharacterized membrane protein YebE (DUF533 family)
MKLDTIDANKILGKLLSSGAATGIAGALAGGMLVSKRGRKLGKKVVELGGIAAVAGMAWMAYERYRGGAPAGNGGPAALIDTVRRATIGGFLPASSEPERKNELGLTLIRAMIAAASADGKLEGREGDAIFRAVHDLALGPAEKALLLGELGKPVEIDVLVAAATTPPIAAEIYTAALLAIELDTPAEHAWLSTLASKLGLDPALVAQLEGGAEQEPERARAAG